MKRGLQITLTWLLVLSIPSVARPQQPHTPQGGTISAVRPQNSQPWLIDLEARIQQRSAHFPHSSRIKAAAASGELEIIDGRNNPELLLPWELHRFLISTAFYEDSTVAMRWRSRFTDAVPSLKVPETFWVTLERLSSDYLRTQHELASLSNEMKGTDKSHREQLRQLIVAKESGQCHQRQIALDRAGQTFGREWFAEFLYRAVAPNVMISSTAPVPVETLRFVGRGCQ